MLPGYNTNGFAHHDLADALSILSEIGYRSVAVTLERGQLDPPERSGARRAAELIKPLVEEAGLRITIETGSRFLLDPRRKHQPTLISSSAEERSRRIEFLKAAVDVAAELSADSVSLWSGSADDAPTGGEGPADSEGPANGEFWNRLTESLNDVLDYAAARNVRLSFEPEPGMFIDTMHKFEQLQRRLDHPLLGLTLDVGHVCCLDDGSLRAHIHRWRERLWNVHVSDMRPGVHEHLMFGEGNVDFATMFDALLSVSYAGPVHVELSRHSHDAVAAARRSYEFLRGFIPSAASP